MPAETALIGETAKLDNQMPPSVRVPSPEEQEEGSTALLRGRWKWFRHLGDWDARFKPETEPADSKLADMALAAEWGLRWEGGLRCRRQLRVPGFLQGPHTAACLVRGRSSRGCGPEETGPTGVSQVWFPGRHLLSLPTTPPSQVPLAAYPGEEGEKIQAPPSPSSVELGSACRAGNGARGLEFDYR